MDLGDPGTSKIQITPQNHGDYVFKVDVSDGEKHAQQSLTVSIYNTAPVAIAGDDFTSIGRDNAATLNGGDSTDTDSDTLTYQWIILSTPDQSELLTGFGTKATAETTFTPDKLGAYVFKLTVHDGTIDHSDEIEVQVREPVPLADAGPDQVVEEDKPVTLDGESSSDQGAGQLLFTWVIDSVPDKSAVTSLSDPDTAKPGFTPDLIGEYHFSLSVDNGYHVAEDSVVVYATNPGAEFNLAFVSPAAVTGDLGGLDGADGKCNSWAGDAGLPGSYVAMLSTEAVEVHNRLGNTRGWIRVDGRPFADTPEDLFNLNHGPLTAPRIDPYGNNLGQQSVWSASYNNGTYNSYGGDCVGWTATTGDARYGFSDTSHQWLDRETNEPCSTAFHLYCLQTDHYKPLQIEKNFAESGRRIFVSNSRLNVGSGIAGADALCQADADATSGLEGNFRALLADIGTSAIDRFTKSNTLIVRLDGLRVADDLKALATQDLVHPVTLMPDGNNWDFRVFTGGASPATVGTAEGTCSGWSQASGRAFFGFSHGTSVSSDRSWFNNGTDNCNSRNDELPVYCLEDR